ncbi:MAG TPA: fluoride efflux transporter CrcB [Gammaproteobacteria bacterium]|nr:fluoride efflux transporter CrcB [Gammaproteobacteria bacterium]
MFPITLQNVLLVAVGGAMGATARLLLVSWTHRQLGVSFPWGTLTVNLTGSLLAGFVFGFFVQRQGLEEAGQIFLLVGVLGAFTTFSAFSLDSLRLIESGAFGLTLVSISANLFGCLCATWMAMQIARFI